MTNSIACLILVSCVTANLGTLGFTPTPAGRNCGLPGKIENGYLAVPDHSYGSVANYYCSTGYKLVGNSQIMCTDNGWSASAPRCERVRPINPMPEPKLTDEEGLTVMLPCTFNVSPGTVDLTHLVVKWEFQGNPVVTFIDNQLSSSRKAWLFQDELRKGNASLLLTNVSSADKGNYTCVIQYFSEVIRKMTANLNIDDVSPPSTKPGSKEDDQARPTILLPCYFTVDSGTVDLNHLKVQWQFKGNHAAKFAFNILFNSKKAHLSLEELRKGNASLVVINASSADTGDYTCDISYKSDSIPRVTVILSIQDVAPSKTKPDTDVTIEQKQAVLLPCYFTESETVDLNHLVVQWEFNGKHLAKFSNNIMLDSKHAKLSVDELKKGNASLILTEVSLARAGDYTCDVKYFSVTKPTAKIILNVEDISRTVITPDIEPADQEGPTVLLPCYFSVESGTVDLNHLTVRWEFQGNRAAMYTDNILFNSEKTQLSLEELRKGNASLVLTNASPVDAGDYSCDISYKSDTKPRVTISLTTQDVSPPSITPGFQVGDQEGPTVLLPCYFRFDSGTVDLNHLTVRWEFQGNHAANYTDNILFNSERAQLSLEELKKGNASLVVINASPADAGDYTCDISYKSDSKPKLTVILSIQDVAPSKSTPDTNVTTQQEKVMLLPCYFTVESGLVDLNHLVVQWEFKEDHLARFSNNTMFDSKRAKLSVDDLKNGNASLVLTDVSSADAGDYTCDVKYLSDNKPRVSITLRENDVSPPNVTTGSQEKDQQRPTVLLPCYFSVNSGTADLDHLTVRWEFHGNHVAKYTDNVLFNSRRAQLSVEELRKGNASLVVINASPADAGDYTCDISYKSDNKPRVTVILNIQDAVPTKPTPDTNVTTQQTHAVLLPCYFTVESGSVDLNHLVVQWEFNGNHLARFTNNVMFGSKRAWLPVDELQNGNASLVLTEVSSADAGDYTCDVSYKSDTQPRVNISLSKNDVAPPTTTPGSQGADYQGPTVVLPCYFSVDSGTVDLHHLEVLWQFKENRVARFADNSLFSSRRAWLSVDELRKGNASLVLTNVSPGDEGDYTCDVKYFSDTKPRVTLSLHTEDIASSTITPDSQGADYQGPTVVLPCYFSVDSGTVDLRHLVVLWQSKEKEVAKFADNILINSRRAWLSVDELRKGNASLVLASVSPADAGDYTCDVQYLSDTKPRVTVSLNAEDVAPPTTTPGSQGADYQGTTVVLPCYFSVDTGVIQLHHLVVLWQFKEKRMALFTDVSLFNSRRAWLSVDELRKGNASLVLTNVSPADAGDYTCDVKYLSDTKPRVTVSLNSEDIAPPTTTPDSQGADYQGPTVVLPCYFSVDSGTLDLRHLVVLWQSKEKQVAKFADNILFNSTSSWLSVDELRKGNASLVLTNVSTADAGDYTCDVKYLSDTKPRVTVSLNAEDVAPPATTPGSQGPDYQGPTVVLPCYFNVDAETVDLHHLFVLWQSNEKQVASFADNILFNSRRAWLSVDELRKGNASLVLTNVSPADGGDYTCDVKYLSDTKPRVTVSLNAEDIAPSSTIPGTNVTVGHTVLLPCYFSVDSGTPALQHLIVEWEFNKTPLVSFTDNILFNNRRAWLFADELRKGNASLVLTNVSPADKGDYTCNIRDLSGKKPKVTVSLTSEDLSPPSTTPDSKGADHHGHTVLLPCYFSVDSETVNLNQLVVQWQHGENDIAKFMNNNLFIKRRAWLSVDGLKKGNASLLLFDVSPADTGDYTCDVNYISDTKPKVTVSLNKDDVSPPSTTPGIDDTHQHGHTVLLPCYFRFDSETADLNHLVVRWESQGNPVARFSKNSLFIKRRAWLSVDELKKGNASLVLTNVSPADEGDYTCDVKYLSDTKSRMDIALRIEDGKPETFIRGPSVRDRERSTVVLPCYFTIESGTTDFSHLVVEWEFQGYHVARFENNIIYKSIAASLSEDELRKGNASLTLTSVSPEDEGDYICDVTYLSDTKAKVIVTLNVDAIDCGTLPDINNGNAEYINGTGFGSVVYFHCNEGYKLIGSNYRTCLTAEWDQQSPRCIRMRCEKPSSIPDGEYELEETVNSQTVAIYRCTKGFLIGEGKLQCTSAGIWKGNLPSCRDLICGGPPLVPHGAYELKFRTSEGDAESEIVATYTCDKGHIVGHDSLVCTSSGTWSEPKPFCKVECDEPPTLENAYIHGGRTTFPIGAKLSYRCRPGYTGLQGTIICHQTAKWTRPRSTCRPRSCGSLEDLPNGRIEFEGGITFGAVARFYCDDGYNLIGRSYRTCLADGWDYQNPSCEALTCDEPPSIKDGTHDLYFNGGDIQSGQVVTYKCQKGKLVGEKSIFCTSEGTWSGKPPKCIVSKCPNIDIQHGRKTSNFGPNYEYGDLVTYDCKRGYNLRGSSQIKCEENDIWTPAPPTCEIKDCGPLPAITNGRITYKTGTTFGSSALFKCDIGYKIHGSYYRKCDDDGWDSTNPICEKVSCKEPHVENGIKISDNASVYYYDDKITFECKPRFEMKGKPTIRCNERGEWSPETPKCTVKSELCIAVEERKKFYQCGMSWDNWTAFLAQEKLYLEIRKLKLLEKRYSKIAVMKKYISDMFKKDVNEI